jgi:hypothetical protein
VPVPGFRPDDVHVTFQDGIIAVNGKADRRSFSRSFRVPEDVDPDAIEARVNLQHARADARAPSRGATEAHRREVARATRFSPGRSRTGPIFLP